MKYDKAYQELTKIIQDLQGDDVGLDELSKKIKKAGELIQFCKEKLRDVEKEITSLK